MRVLTYVDLVARTGSIRKAAERLHISSTAVNRAILALERELGLPLFERRQNGVRLSAAGESYVVFARHTLGELARVRSEVEDLRGLRRGHISVAAIQSVAGTLLPLAIAAYQTQYPGVAFEVAVMGNDAILEALDTDEVELGIAFNPPAHDSMTTLASVDQTLCVVMGSGHPLAGRPALRLHECIEYPLALADSSRIGRQLMDGMLRRAGFRGGPALVSDSFELLASWCRAGQGLCFQISVGVPEGMGLVAIPLQERAAPGPLVVAARRGRMLTVQASTFAEALASTFRGQSAPRSRKPRA